MPRKCYKTEDIPYERAFTDFDDEMSQLLLIKPDMTFLDTDDVASGQNDGASDTTEIIVSRTWRPDLDMWDVDPQGVYGLRPEFLKSLNITPPIDKWVHVTNFECDKSELREVMELAGNVLICVVTAIKRYAKIMYSHPLEAIQAISMLDGQMLYGKPLGVIMDKNPTNTIVLPKGLANIGLGLGLGGKPILNIAHQYHRYAANQSSFINPVLFSKVNYYSDEATILQHEDSSDKEIQRKIDELTSSAGFCLSPEPGSFKELNIEEDYDTKNMEKRKTSTPKLKDHKIEHVESSNSSLDSTSSTSKNEVQKSNENLRKLGPIGPIQKEPLIGHIAPNQGKPLNNSIAPTQGNPLIDPIAPTPGKPLIDPIARFKANDSDKSVPKKQHLRNAKVCPQQNGKSMQSPQGIDSSLHSPSVHHSFRPGFTTFSQLSPHSLPFVPTKNPFRPRSLPTGFRPTSVIRPQMPPPYFGIPRTFIWSIAMVPQPCMNCDTVHISNLPLTMTFPMLCEKLAKCGQLIAVQLTTPGCALVKFSQPSYAEKCIQMYNQSNIDGYIIEVRHG